MIDGLWLRIMSWVPSNLERECFDCIHTHLGIDLNNTINVNKRKCIHALKCWLWAWGHMGRLYQQSSITLQTRNKYCHHHYHLLPYSIIYRYINRLACAKCSHGCNPKLLFLDNSGPDVCQMNLGVNPPFSYSPTNWGRNIGWRIPCWRFWFLLTQVVLNV